jgi:S1-C subfamily serine protease
MTVSLLDGFATLISFAATGLIVACVILGTTGSAAEPGGGGGTRPAESQAAESQAGLSETGASAVGESGMGSPPAAPAASAAPDSENPGTIENPARHESAGANDNAAATGIAAAIGNAAAMESAIIEAIARSEKSVVAIARVRRSEENEENSSAALLRVPTVGSLSDVSPLSPDFVPNDFGAGVVVDAAGLILTTYHVLGEQQKSDFYVWSQRRPYKAIVVSADPWSDLAVLRVDAKDLVPITFGDAKQARKGQLVIALGNPYAIARDGEASASWGIISNLLRRAPRVADRSADPQARDSLHQFGTLIQTDARLNFGYSGGALVNLRGEMIGLTTAYAAGADFEASAGFAIPVDAQFVQTVEKMKTGRRPAFGFLGVGPEPLSEAQRQSGVRGARVVSVVEGTPAARGGVIPGDIITHINQEPVLDDTDLFRIVGSFPSGATANLTILRASDANPAGETIQRQVTLTKRFLNSPKPQIGEQDLAKWRGMSVDDSSAAPSFSYLGPHLDPTGCVYVAAVEQDSPAWKSGLRSGVFVSFADGKRVTSPAEFRAATETASGSVELVVLTGQGSPTRQTVSP